MRPDCAPRRPRASRSAISTAAAWSSASSKARASATVTSCFRPNCSTSCARIGAWRGQCTGCFPGVIPSIRSIRSRFTPPAARRAPPRGSTSVSPSTRCATVSRPICSRAAPISASSRRCSAIATSTPLPAAAAQIAFQNKRVVYAILFRAAADALRDIAADPRHLGAEIGAVAVLHTWGQALHHHPHLHCIVPSGGLSPDQTSWISCRPGFFLPVRVLSRRFRRLFLGRLQAAFAAGELRFSGMLAALTDPTAFAGRLADLRGIEWVVYAKRPFAGPQQVLAYLGRYTHRVALANSRLIRLANGQVSFTWKDYRREGETKVMTLAADELMQRFP